MNIPRALLIGRVGQVGWELRRTLAPLTGLVAVDYPDIDLTNPDSIRGWVRETSPDLVINAGAYTAVDKAESEPELAMKINGIAPGILAEECKSRGALLVHFSTDYVFDGTKTTPYIEDDAPNPLGAYGRSKLAGDKAVLAIDGAYLIFRLCWVYGTRGSNFMLTIMRLARERDRLRVVQDQVGCPTWSRMIAETTTMAIARTLSGNDFQSFRGVYHLAATGSTSWHGFAQAIVDRMAPEERRCTTVEPIPASEYPVPARRPAFSVLDCAKLRNVFGLQLPDWQASLLDALEK